MDSQPVLRVAELGSHHLLSCAIFTGSRGCFYGMCFRGQTQVFQEVAAQ